jgi:hypothetical protein
MPRPTIHELRARTAEQKKALKALATAIRAVNRARAQLTPANSAAGNLGYWAGSGVSDDISGAEKTLRRGAMHLHDAHLMIKKMAGRSST